MDKAKIIAAILEHLGDEFESRRRTSRQTRAEGNHEESKAESKYDTLAIEDNYLADGFARQALAAAQAAKEIEKMPIHRFTRQEPIGLGALVELEFGDAREWFLLAPSGGGTVIMHGAANVTVLTLESPLGSQLLGCRTGDCTTAPLARIVRVV